MSIPDVAKPDPMGQSTTLECHALLLEMAEMCRAMAGRTRSAPAMVALENAAIEFDRLAARITPYAVPSLAG